MADPRVKRLTISANVVKRLSKEKSVYEEDAKKCDRTHGDKVSSKADEYEIKLAKSLLDESKMMVSDCNTRLSKAVLELDNLIGECGDLSETEQFKTAKSVYDSVSH